MFLFCSHADLENPLADELDLPFIEAIARGWGLAIRHGSCGRERRWSDADLAKRFLGQLDQPLSILRGRISCADCGDKARITIYAYQAGVMNWQTASKQYSDMLKTIEDHKAELRGLAKAAAQHDKP